MARWALALAAAGVAVILLLLLVAIARDPDPVRQKVPDSAAVAEAAGTGSPRAAAAPIRDPRRVAGEPGGAEVEPPAGEVAPAQEAWAEAEPARVQLRLARDVPQRILDAASACYRDQPGKREKVVLRYRLEVSGGAGRLTEVSVGESDVGDPELERCVLAEVAGLTLDLPGVPDLAEEAHVDVTVAALRKRARGMGDPDPAADDD